MVAPVLTGLTRFSLGMPFIIGGVVYASEVYEASARPPVDSDSVPHSDYHRARQGNAVEVRPPPSSLLSRLSSSSSDVASLDSFQSLVATPSDLITHGARLSHLEPGPMSATSLLRVFASGTLFTAERRLLSLLALAPFQSSGQIGAVKAECGSAVSVFRVVGVEEGDGRTEVVLRSGLGGMEFLTGVAVERRAGGEWTARVGTATMVKGGKGVVMRAMEPLHRWYSRRLAMSLRDSLGKDFHYH